MVEISIHGRVEGGKLVLMNPVPLPDGAEVVDTIVPNEHPWHAPAPEEVEEFASLPFFAMWADREDMADSVAWVRRLRGHCPGCKGHPD
jgi:hypothetical protein